MLVQHEVPGKANEITALPDLIKQLDLRGAVVSIDAIGCQKTVAEQIVAAKADYVLALKDNYPTLREEVALWLDEQTDKGALPILETVDKDHGRLEVRRYTLSGRLDWPEPRAQWKGLEALGRVESIRHVGGREAREYRYFLSSIGELKHFASVVRDHWAIENSQHWVLDVQFREDATEPNCCLARIPHRAIALGGYQRVRGDRFPVACVALARNWPQPPSMS